MRRVAGIVLVMMMATRVSAQDAKPKVLVSPFGVEIFARLLDQHGLQPLTAAEQLGTKVPLSHCVVIILGSAKPLDGLRLDRLRDGGASLLVATDRDATLSWSPTDSVIVHPRKLLTYEQNDTFFGDPHCPWVDPWGERKLPVAHPIFKGLDKPVASNCPSFIADRNGQFVEPIAWLPPSTRIEGNRPLAIQFRFPLPYAVATPGEADQRVLVLAGHGVFMNCMTIRDDIGNRQFADNVVAWLKGHDRKHVLFYHENVLKTEFKLPLVGEGAEMPLPPITLDIVERMLGAIQEDGFFQRMFDRSAIPSAVLRVVLIVTTLLVFLYGLKKLFGVRVLRPEAGAPYVLGVQNAPHRPLAEKRNRELTGRHRFAEPARELARSWFREVTGHEPTPASEIAFEVTTGSSERRRLGREIDMLRRLAIGADKGIIDESRLFAIARSIEALGAAVERGELTFPAALQRV